MLKCQMGLGSSLWGLSELTWIVCCYQLKTVSQLLQLFFFSGLELNELCVNTELCTTRLSPMNCFTQCGKLLPLSLRYPYSVTPFQCDTPRQSLPPRFPAFSVRASYIRFRRERLKTHKAIIVFLRRKGSKWDQTEKKLSIHWTYSKPAVKPLI